MQTMFVPPSPSSPSRAAGHFPYAAQPLKPLHSNILAASESCIQLQWPDAPQSVYESPLHKQFRDVLQVSLFQNGESRAGSPTKTGRGAQQQQPQDIRGLGDARHNNPHASSISHGLGWGLDKIGMQADLFANHSNQNARTRAAFKPARAAKGTNSWQLKQFAEATLGSGSLRKVVKLPEGEDKDEWLAVNGTGCLYNFERLGRVLTMRLSGRLLQPDQLAVWRHHRVLQPTVMSRNEGYRRVRHAQTTPWRQDKC